MAIYIREVKTSKELKQFIKFPFDLYKDNAYYVPPFIKEEKEVLNQLVNPVFKFAEASYFLAIKENKIVGRVAAIINWEEVKNQQKQKMRFGWFDTIDDLEVSTSLLNKVEEIGKKNNLKYIEGPVGFSNLDKAGLLTKGFNKIATMITLYNYPYYADHFKKLDFEVANEWVEYAMEVPEILPSKIIKFTDIIKERYHLKNIEFKKTKELLPYVEQMFDLLDKTYNSLDTYVPISKTQIEYYKKKYIPFINPEFVNCVVNEKNEMIAFAITMPSYSRAMQKARGKLFPTGWWHLLQANKKNDTAAFYLIGIHPKYQGKGVTSIIFSSMFETFQKNNIKYLETNPELVENESIQVLWKMYNPVNHKRRMTFRRQINYD